MKTSEGRQFEQSTRRQWLVAGARYALLGGLAVVSGRLVLQSQRAECREGVACQRCRAWKTCRLPLAVETRKKVGG